MYDLTRRSFLRVTAVILGSSLAACAPRVPAPTAAPKQQTPAAPKAEAPAKAPVEPAKVVYVSKGDEARWTGEKKCLQPFIDAHPEIELEYVGMKTAPMYQRVLADLAAGTPPDMLRHNYHKMHAWAAKGVLLALNDYFARDSIDPVETFVKPHEAVVYKGTWYGTPRGSTGNDVVYYNRDMFDEAGIEWPEKTPDWTWDDFLEIAKSFVKDTTGDGKIDTWGSEFPMRGWQTFIWNWGGDYLNDDVTACTINSPEATAGLQFLADLRVEHGVCPFPAMLPEGMGDAFLVGKVAMGIKGPWRMSLFYEADFDWGFATIPAGPADQVSYGKPNAEVIFSGSKAKDASWEVLKYLNGEESNKCEAVEIGWGPNLNSVMYSDWYLKRDTPPYDMSASVPDKLIGIRGEEMSIHADQMQVMLRNELDPVWAGDKKASEVLPDLERKVTELLSSDEVELS